MNNKKEKINYFLKMNRSLGMTGMVLLFLHCSVYASDLQIYKNRDSENQPIIMLALDNSQGMNTYDSAYQNKKMIRIDAFKHAIINALNEKDELGHYRIPENVAIGISTFTNVDERGGTDDWLKVSRIFDENVERSNAAKILIPARRLNEQNRRELIMAIQRLSNAEARPTSLLLSETYAYLLGNSTYSPSLKYLNESAQYGRYTTFTRGLSGISLAPAEIVKEGRYIAPLTQLEKSQAMCSKQGVFLLTDGPSVGINRVVAEPVMKNTLNDASFNCDGSMLSDLYYKDSFLSPAQPSTSQYSEIVNTQGLIRRGWKVADRTGHGWKNWSSWSCIGKLVDRVARFPQLSADPNRKSIFTFVASLGSTLEKTNTESCVDDDQDGSFDYCEAKRDGFLNKNFNATHYMTKQTLEKLGKTIGKGETLNTHQEIGGYAHTRTGEDIVIAFQAFLRSLSHSNNDENSYSSTYFLNDSFNASRTSSVFISQFQPNSKNVERSLQLNHQIWMGNLKKYALTKTGLIHDTQKLVAIDSTGRINPNSRDFWDTLEQRKGANLLEGGARSKLLLPIFSDNVQALSETSQIFTRPVFINANFSRDGFNSHVLQQSNQSGLNKLTVESVLRINEMDTTQDDWKQNLYQPYLLSVLGFQLNSEFLKGLPAGYKWDHIDKIKKLDKVREMGGIIHSTPFLITLEADFDPQTPKKIVRKKEYVIFGTTQGLLHILDYQTGEEVFSFLPFEILRDSKKRHTLMHSSDLNDSSLDPIYGLDGAWTGNVEHQIDSKNKKMIAGRAQIYGGMRMGGRSYYALDIKDLKKPKLLFQIDPSEGKVISAEPKNSMRHPDPAIAAMGQSWSKPTLAKIRFQGKIREVMIVGGGYDIAYEADGYLPQTALSDGQSNLGAGVYIFDANTGELIWDVRFGQVDQRKGNDQTLKDMKYSVVSQIKAFDRNADGLVDHLYFGDLGGQVWRIDLNNQASLTNNPLETIDQDKLVPFAKINRLADFSQMNQRFYEMPALSIHEHYEGGRRFGVLSIASGNRSFPLNKSNTYDHRVYVLYDFTLSQKIASNINNDSNSVLEEKDLMNWSDISSSNIGLLKDKSKKGWYYLLRKTRNQEELNNTGTVKALNGYLVKAHTRKFSDLYLSLYNPNDTTELSSGSCGGAYVEGSTRTLRLCLPYGICGDTESNLSVDTLKIDQILNDKVEGIGRINQMHYTENGKSFSKVIGDQENRYITSKRLRSYNWFERY